MLPDNIVEPFAHRAKKANDSTGASQAPQPRALRTRRFGVHWRTGYAARFSRMEQLMVISAVGGDPTAVVQELTRVIMDCGGNIKESRIAAFGSDFAMLLLVSGNWHTVSRMERELTRFANSNGVTMQFKRTEPRRFGKELLPYAVDVVGLDQPGVVHSLSGFFAARKVEIARSLHAQLRGDAHGRADVLRADGHQHPGDRPYLGSARGIHGLLRPAQRRRDHGARQALLTGSIEDSEHGHADRRQENRRLQRRHDGAARS